MCVCDSSPRKREPSSFHFVWGGVCPRSPFLSLPRLNPHPHPHFTIQRRPLPRHPPRGLRGGHQVGDSHRPAVPPPRCGGYTFLHQHAPHVVGARGQQSGEEVQAKLGPGGLEEGRGEGGQGFWQAGDGTGETAPALTASPKHSPHTQTCHHENTPPPPLTHAPGCCQCIRQERAWKQRALRWLPGRWDLRGGIQSRGLAPRLPQTAAAQTR